jgi:Zn-dependent M28 family amino/carboxypeptidase
MQKYLKFNTAAGVHNVPVGSGLFADKIDATETRLYNQNAFLYNYTLVTTGSNVDTAVLLVNINTALERASATTWQNSEVEVQIPSGVVVTSIALTAFS